MTISRSKLIWWIAGGFTVILLYFNAKAHPSTSICWFKSRFGWQCPGCGSQRAMESLFFKGDFFGAMKYNALMVMGIALLTIYLLSYLFNRESTHHFISILINKPWFKWVVLTIVLGFTVQRMY